MDADAQPRANIFDFAIGVEPVLMMRCPERFFHSDLKVELTGKPNLVHGGGDTLMRSFWLAISACLILGCAGESDRQPAADTQGEVEHPIVQGDGDSGTPDHTNAATELMPTDEGEREVPGTFVDAPSGNPDLSDPNIDTSVMPR